MRGGRRGNCQSRPDLNSNVRSLTSRLFSFLFTSTELRRVVLQNFLHKDAAAYISMRLYLIRHGETVDNVAGLYAGSRDSALTNHGVEQTKRLGAYFAKEGIRLTHMFASPLTRAHKTAEAIKTPQKDASTLEVVKVPGLRERDFGRYEGKPYTSQEMTYNAEAQKEDSKTGRQLGGIESGDSLGKRSDSFIDDFLLPLFATDGLDEEYMVAVVAHGMLLSHLWRRLLLRLPRKSLSIAPEITAARGNVILEHLGGWGNTGYLELDFKHNDRDEVKVLDDAQSLASSDTIASESTPIPPAANEEDAAVSLAFKQKLPAAKTDAEKLVGWSTTIIAVDSKQHLVGLKRQRGGIGSSAHDEGQKKLDGFFSKRQKTG